MSLDPASLPSATVEFLSEHHLATLTTLRADGSPHVVPVGFSFDASERLVRPARIASFMALNSFCGSTHCQPCGIHFTCRY